MSITDRTLLTFVGIGIWVLVAVTLGSSRAQAAGEPLTAWAVQRIVENSCTVTGEVHLYRDDEGQILRASIRC